MKCWMLGGVLAAAMAAPCFAVTVDVAPYAKRDDFETIKLSPNGDYYAATVPMEGKSVLLIVRRADNKGTAGFSLGKNTYVTDFEWVSAKRVIISMGRKFGALDQPEDTGDMYAINADGTGSALLVGPDVEQMSTGTHIQGRTTDRVAAFLVDPMMNDDKNALVAITPFDKMVGANSVTTDPDSLQRVDRLDVETGKRVPVLRAPVGNSRFLTDQHGAVRFVSGADSSNVHKLYYKSAENSDWHEINNELSSGHLEEALGFSADNSVAYLITIGHQPFVLCQGQYHPLGTLTPKSNNGRGTRSSWGICPNHYVLAAACWPRIGFHRASRTVCAICWPRQVKNHPPYGSGSASTGPVLSPKQDQIGQTRHRSNQSE